MALKLYTLLLRLGLPFVALRQWWRHRGAPGRTADWREHFGRYLNPPTRAIIWLHAAAVSDARATAALARALRIEYPDHYILVTSDSTVGRDALRNACGNEVLSAYLPYDLPRSVRRFLSHFRPSFGVMVGIDLRPVLLAACRRDRIPMLLANTRLSRSLARSYARFGALTRPALGSFTECGAQDRASARRLRHLGAETVSVTGNINFDAMSDPAKVEEGRALMAALRGRKALLFAGTCPGEEDLLLDALGEDDGTLIIIVPRNPERFEEVAALAAARGMNVARRSLGEAPHVGRRVLLGDTIGEISFYYAVATVAVIGGSFTPFGGQDPIEACAAGVPAVIGPHMIEFAEAARAALVANAAIRVIDADEAIRVVRTLLEIREWRERMALGGLKLSAAHYGATARYLELCRGLSRNPTPLSRPGGPPKPRSRVLGLVLAVLEHPGNRAAIGIALILLMTALGVMSWYAFKATAPDPFARVAHGILNPSTAPPAPANTVASAKEPAAGEPVPAPSPALPAEPSALAVTPPEPTAPATLPTAAATSFQRAPSDDMVRVQLGVFRDPAHARRLAKRAAQHGFPSSITRAVSSDGKVTYRVRLREALRAEDAPGAVARLGQKMPELSPILVPAER